METGKPGSASAPVHSSSVVAPAEKKMDIQAPLTTVYIHTVPALPPQPYPQLPAASQEPATLHLAMPPLYSKETLPFLTLHIAGGLHSQQQGLGLAAAVPVARPKSAGKHMCPHCGRDCMKPSVLEKHLRCHTGERPYPCTTCGVSFKTQSNLYKHKRTQAHARLSSESEQSSMGSQDSLYSSRETCTSSLSLDGHSEESGSLKDITAPSAEISYPASTAQVCSVNKQGPDAGWALMRDSVNEQNNSHSFAQRMKPSESPEITKGEEKQKRMDNEKPALTPTRHLTLQRQEATMFSAHWESSVSRGKSQNHESTDSGFSESSDQYLSPCSALPDHSLDSLTESTLEHLQQPSNPNTSAEATQSGQESKDSVSTQEQRMLEERISKLISENSAVVEDKQLENVRPRKTALSKQGSIDLPMPYMYKDSFHFDMRNSKTPNVGLQRNRKPGLYSSVPTQCSTSTEHAPLTRSSSLPFSVALLQPERSSPTSSYQTDYVTVVRRGSSGQIHPTGFTIKSVDQQVSTHRPLVRQAAVDCNHATEGLFMNSSVEEACAGSLSCDGEGSDICGEPSNRKCRRKKAQKFAYNKWYMYGGGTFKKLYSADKGYQLNLASAVTAGPNTSVVPCHTVAFDSAAQNVFHVHTADLQICLQLISDEQLALIEPQIERRGPETSLSQRNNLDAMDSEGHRTEAPSCVTMESTSEGADRGKTRHQKETNRRERSSPHIHDGTKPLLSMHFQRAQATTPTTEHRDVSQAATSVTSTASESSSQSLNPHGHLNMVTETIKTTGHADSAVALVKGVKSERSQKPEEEHAFPINSSAEEGFVPERSVSQGGVISETIPGQHQLRLQGMTSLSPSTAAQDGMGTGLLHKGSQHKLLNQSTCNADTVKIKCKASVYECTLENGETCLPPQARLCEASNPGGGDALPTKVSLFPNICTVSREVNPQTPVYSDLVDSRLENSEILHSFKHADTGRDTVGPSERSVPLQDMTLHKTQDRTSSAQRRGQFRPTSVPCSIQLERAKDVTDVLTTNQSSITGCIEGGSLAGCAAQEEPETRGHGSTIGRPDSTDREPTESQEAGDLDPRCMEGQDRRGLAGEDRDGGMWSIKTDEVLEQAGKAQSNGRCIHLSDMIKPEEEERKVEADPYENSRLSEQHHQHVSQPHVGMSEGPQSRTSTRPDPPDSSDTSLFAAPQPDTDVNAVYFSQQHSEIKVAHNRQTQILRETSSSLHNNQPCGLVHTLSETGQPQTQQFIHNETVSHWNHETQDQRQTEVALPAHVLPQRESSSAGNRSAQFNSVKPSSSAYPAKVSHSVCVSRAQGGMSAEAQTTDLGALDNTAWPAKSWTSAYPEHDNKQQSRDQATHEHMTHSSDPAKADITSKYQSLFSVGQLHGYQSLECLTSGVRPVQSCQDYPDDTSSSDDEGKLIIEL
ncbi:zinc finger protein 831 [Polymixia lowei]